MHTLHVLEFSGLPTSLSLLIFSFLSIFGFVSLFSIFFCSFKSFLSANLHDSVVVLSSSDGIISFFRVLQSGMYYSASRNNDSSQSNLASRIEKIVYVQFVSASICMRAGLFFCVEYYLFTLL